MMVNAADALGAWYPDRFVLGLGVSHEASVVRMLGGEYPPPLESMRRYLDGIDAISAPSDAARPRARGIGAQAHRPRRRARTAAHISTTCRSLDTARSREVLGDGPLLIPEQKVVFERDADVARTLARRSLPLRLPNYANALVRLGFDPEAVAGVDDESSTRSWRGATTTPSPSASRSSSTPAPTTWRCRCCGTSPARRSTSGAVSLRSFPS